MTPDVLWRVPVKLDGAYWTAELAVTTGPAGSADDAKALAQGSVDGLKDYVSVRDPAAGDFVVGEPYRA